MTDILYHMIFLCSHQVLQPESLYLSDFLLTRRSSFPLHHHTAIIYRLIEMKFTTVLCIAVVALLMLFLKGGEYNSTVYNAD